MMVFNKFLEEKRIVLIFFEKTTKQNKTLKPANFVYIWNFFLN